LGPDSICTWKQLEEQFHIQYHSEATEAGIADLAQVRQKRGETVAEYIQRFREVKNRCYSTRISEKEAVELVSVGLVKPIRDLVFQLEFNSLAHLVQKMTVYEQRHPELYQDKFKHQVVVVDAEDSEDSGDDREIAVVSGHGGQNPCAANG
jgi:histone acetyltransferase (RNA polymerase elongator complex component)